jgi:hypothetical protein
MHTFAAFSPIVRAAIRAEILLWHLRNISSGMI